MDCYVSCGWRDVNEDIHNRAGPLSMFIPLLPVCGFEESWVVSRVSPTTCKSDSTLRLHYNGRRKDPRNIRFMVPNKGGTPAYSLG